MLIADRWGNVCPPKRNGSAPHEAVLIENDTHGVMMGPGVRHIPGPRQGRRMLDRFRRMRTAFMTWPEMSGNGRTIGTIATTTRSVLNAIQPGPPQVSTK